MGRAHATPIQAKSEAIGPGFGILPRRGPSLSRTLNNDFDEDELPSGGLDLETGSHVGGSGVSSSYAGEGTIDFDDDLHGDEAGPGGALELDLPGGGRPAGAPVPDLAVDAKSSRAPVAGSGDNVPAAKQSGQVPAARSSGAHAAAPPHTAPPPNSSGRAPSGASGAPPAGPSDSGAHAPHREDARGSSTAPASSSGRYAAQHGGSPAEPLPPPPPTAAALIAKYPSPPTGIAHAPMYAVRVVLRQLELRTDLESLRRRRSPDVPLYEAALRAYEPKTFRLGMAINVALLVIGTFIFFLPVIIRFMRAD